MRTSVRLALAAGLIATLSAPALAQTNTQWLDAVFSDLLHRPADAGAIDAFVPPLDAHTLTRTQVAHTILDATEYRGVAVSAYFQDFLNRPAAPGEVDPFVGLINAGATHEGVRADLVGSLEYFTLHGSAVPGFIAAMYDDLLHRAADPAGITFFTTFLASHSRQDAALNLEGSLEYRQTLVGDWFDRFLDRVPTTTEVTNFAGQLGLGARDEDVIAQLLGSDEYFRNIPAPAGALLPVVAILCCRRRRATA